MKVLSVLDRINVTKLQIRKKMTIAPFRILYILLISWFKFNIDKIMKLNVWDYLA